MHLLEMSESEITLLALTLLRAEDNAWKEIEGPEDLVEIRELRLLLRKLPTRGLVSQAVKEHCRSRPIS